MKNIETKFQFKIRRNGQLSAVGNYCNGYNLGPTFTQKQVPYSRLSDKVKKKLSSLKPGMVLHVRKFPRGVNLCIVVKVP